MLLLGLSLGSFALRFQCLRGNPVGFSWVLHFEVVLHALGSLYVLSQHLNMVEIIL